MGAPSAYESPVYWSVRPSNPGSLTGWVRIEPATRLRVEDNPRQHEVSIRVLAAAEAQTFSTKVRSPAPTLGYVLSVLGSVIGTLLASLPAWLAWYEKRRQEIGQGSTKRIVVP